MAKKTVASLQKGEGRTYSKVIRVVKSPKTGAYTFQEQMVPNDAVKDGSQVSIPSPRVYKTTQSCDRPPQWSNAGLRTEYSHRRALKVNPTSGALPAYMRCRGNGQVFQSRRCCRDNGAWQKMSRMQADGESRRGTMAMGMMR